MKARLVVFPVKGRTWCFSRTLDRTSVGSGSTESSPTLKDLWNKITSNRNGTNEKAELVADFVSEKMNRAWIGLEKAPVGTVKNKIYGLGLRLLSRVQPSEIFLRSISKEINNVEITFPMSLNPRLVRRRLRHLAMRGSILHRRYLYGSVSLLPLTTVFTVLPLPNIPFFWILFRAYSHWRALKGSERLLLLVSDCSKSWGSVIASRVGKRTSQQSSVHKPHDLSCPWVLQPSEELKKLLDTGSTEDSISNSAMAEICKAYDLENREVQKFRDSL